jgi:hypothetical protein
MFPILITIAKGALIAVFLAAFLTAIWANSRMTKRRRETGGRYWMVNPRPIVANWVSIEFPIFIAAVIVGASAVAALKALS